MAAEAGGAVFSGDPSFEMVCFLKESDGGRTLFGRAVGLSWALGPSHLHGADVGRIKLIDVVGLNVSKVTRGGVLPVLVFVAGIL